MLRMNKLADYGTVVMVHLAKTEEKLSARDIAGETHLSLTTVSKVLKRLATEGLLVSQRGSKGGYQLSKHAKEISITDILYALDETRGLTSCSHEPETCALHRVCHVEENWRKISLSIERALKSVSLEDLATPVLPESKLKHIEVVVTGANRVKSQ